MRGIIEGFYGKPWSWSERSAVCAQLAAAGMDTYVYAPKDDPLHRQRWREPYGDGFLEELDTFVGSSRLSVGFAVSPGLSLDVSSNSDLATLIDKFRSVIDVGVRSVGVFFDDIPPSEGLGSAHGRVVAQVRDELDSEVDVFMCPLHYTGTVRVPYLAELSATVPREVPVAWTGAAVVNDAITSAQARTWSEAMDGRLPLLWDNVPVNDTVMADTLPMKPLEGRDVDLPEHLSGYLANPMVQASASVASLLSAASWLAGEDPVGAFERALSPEAALFAECVAPRRLEQTSQAVIAGEPSARKELAGFFRNASSCTEADLGEAVAPWAEQIRAEAAVAQLALAVLDSDHRTDAHQSALVCLMAWPPLSRGRLSVFGGRGSMRPAMGQDATGEWVPLSDCMVQPASVVDALVAAAFDSLDAGA